MLNHKWVPLISVTHPYFKYILGRSFSSHVREWPLVEIVHEHLDRVVDRTIARYLCHLAEPLQLDELELVHLERYRLLIHSSCHDH